MNFQLFFKKRPDVNQIWNPSAFGHTNGRALAKLFGILANGGSYGGKELMSQQTIVGQTKIVKSGYDKATKTDISYGRGYTIFMSPKVGHFFD